MGQVGTLAEAADEGFDVVGDCGALGKRVAERDGAGFVARGQAYYGFGHHLADGYRDGRIRGDRR